LITETLGHLGVDEGIVATVADARGRLLKPGARLVPERIDILLALTSDRLVHERELCFWRGQVKGVSLASAVPVAAARVYLRTLTEGELLTTPRRAARIELGSATEPPGRLELETTARADAAITGIAAWFECDLGAGVHLSSRATSSWFPLLFPLRPPVEVRTLDPCVLRVESRALVDEVAWSWTVETAHGRGEGGRR
ncbi:MAG: hypothetical protein ABIJ09_27060, partial [Pseudomonadota bacterium]